MESEKNSHVESTPEKQCRPITSVYRAGDTCFQCHLVFRLIPTSSPRPDFTDGRPYRHTKAYRHPSSLMHHQSDSCSASQPCSKPWHHLKSSLKGVSYCKPALLEGYFLAHLPVLFYWNLKREQHFPAVCNSPYSSRMLP